MTAFVPADRLAHQPVNVGEVQLFLDARGVALDGLETDVQMFRNLPV